MNLTKSLLLASILIPFLTFSQMSDNEVRNMVKTASEQELVFHSSTMMQQQFYYHAEIVVDELLKKKPESANYHYRKGFLIMSTTKNHEEALPHLQIAVKATKKHWDIFSPKETGTPMDAYYYLGQAYHLGEDITKAKEYYNLFIENSTKSSHLIELSKLKLKQCDVARKLISQPKTAVVKNIGSLVNTSVAEYSPVISLDGTSLYFTSRRAWEDGSTEDFRDPILNNHPEDIFVSYQDFDGEWTSPEKLAFCESQYNEATIAVSSDERKIYVYNDASGGGDIYFSKFGSNKFEEIEKLRHKGVNSDAWETHITVTPDGENMYFVSDREGGFGGRDIYRIVKLPNGEWSEPFNLGPKINTPYDEDSPFIAVNNKTLYYSSNGPESMGEMDVFVTFRDDNNQWSEPVNMGYPINSTGDDVFYTTTVDGLKGYLSSHRKGGHGEKDIYEVQNDYLGTKPVSGLYGTVSNLDGTDLADNISVKLLCTNCESVEHQETEPRIKNGRYFAFLKRCREYTVEVYEGDQLIRKSPFTTLCNGENEEIVRDFMIGEYTLEATVSDIKSLELLDNAKIDFRDPKNNNPIASYSTNSQGLISSDLLTGRKKGETVVLDVHIERDGYLTQTFKAEFTLANNPIIKLEYLLSKKEVGTDVGAVLSLNPIYFDIDKSNIRPDAAVELDKIVTIMNENPQIKIELGSHTDCRSSKRYNLSLSNRRAKSSAEYIKQRISDPSRIYGKGYGESQLVNDCGCEGNVVSDCSEEEHQANRRTEFKIIE